MTIDAEPFHQGQDMTTTTTIKSFLAAAALTFGVAAHAVDITGAGATFPYPIYAKWAEAYKQKTGVGMNYQSIGSGGGIAQIKAKTVDFGASDMPLKPEDLQAAGLTHSSSPAPCSPTSTWARSKSGTTRLSPT
jgi:phosphate transport system substrate-binding protein